VGIADYRADGARVVFPHTEVDRAYRGRGVGDALVRRALDDARRRRVKVVPSCWFFADYLGRHPDDRDLVAPPSGGGSGPA
jgi:uncharacterized protein